MQNKVLYIEDYIELIHRTFPQVEMRIAQPITSGWDSFVLNINDELIFRFPMRDDVAVYFQKEIALLPLLTKRLTTSIPHFQYIGRDPENRYAYTFVGYPKLQGVPLSTLPQYSTQLVANLGTFLHNLHTFPIADAINVGVEENTADDWREIYRERYRDLQKRVFPTLDHELCERSAELWEHFLEADELFAFQPALIHADLAEEHILCDPVQATLAGVIDWGDAMIGDPALDFVGLFHYYGQSFVEQVLAYCAEEVNADFWRRIAFYHCYGPFSELLYGAYSDIELFTLQGIAGLKRLFGL